MIIIHKEYLIAAPFVLTLLLYFIERRMVDLSPSLIIVGLLWRGLLIVDAGVAAWLLFGLLNHIQIK